MDSPAPFPGTPDLSTDEAMARLMADPAGFVREIVDAAAEQHLLTLKEKAELQGALRGFGKQYPEFERFRPFVLREVAEIIQNDPDGIIDPWPDLLEKGMKRFREKFQATLDEQKAEAGGDPAARAFLEGGANRVPAPTPPSFTREQIDRMTLAEFLAQEPAIDEALRQRRIR